MSNLLAEAINCDDPDRAARIIREALGIESDDVVGYCFPTEWPADPERRACYIGEWLNRTALPRVVTEPPTGGTGKARVGDLERPLETTGAVSADRLSISRAPRCPTRILARPGRRQK
jgi:hypothetical protein